MCIMMHVPGKKIETHTLPSFDVCLLTAAKGVSSGISAFMAAT